MIRLLSKTKGPSCINNTVPTVWHKMNPNQWSSHSLLLRKMTAVTEGQDNQAEDLYCDRAAFHRLTDCSCNFRLQVLPAWPLRHHVIVSQPFWSSSCLRSEGPTWNGHIWKCPGKEVALWEKQRMAGGTGSCFHFEAKSVVIWQNPNIFFIMKSWCSCSSILLKLGWLGLYFWCSLPHTFLNSELYN